MNSKPQDLKPRTKTFALRIIRMYSELPKNDTVAQVLGKQVLRSGTSARDIMRKDKGLNGDLGCGLRQDEQDLQDFGFRGCDGLFFLYPVHPVYPVKELWKIKN
jgi:hypothetical protein